MLKEEERFQANLKLLEEKYPELAEIINTSKSNPWKLTHPSDPYSDIVNTQSPTPFYFFNSKPVDSYLRHWVSGFLKDEPSVIIIYGLGMGYPWNFLNDWLSTNPSNKLFFIEDDVDLLATFLKSSSAHALLSNSQTHLYFLRDNSWDERNFIKEVIYKNIFRKYITATLPYYQIHKNDKYKSFKIYIEQRILNGRVGLSETFGLDTDHLTNFWTNYHLLVDSNIYSLLKDQFKDIPAIVVSAGPSLEKNIHLLKHLSNKALIIAGGTAVNVLNSNGIEPHIVVGVDPFNTFSERTALWTSFERPLFYALRMNKAALAALNNPLVYLNAGVSLSLEKYYSEVLKISFVEQNFGSNVGNASLTMASFLGCQLLVTIGVDLAYTDNKSYGPRLKKNALNPTVFKTKAFEKMIQDRDIYGQPIKTLEKWLMESFWYGEFKLTHPQLHLINATEGGLGFPGVENATLEQVSRSYFTSSYDIEGQLHAAIQKAQIPDRKSVNIYAFRNDILNSLENLNSKIAELIKVDKSFNDIYLIKDIDRSTITPSAKTLLEQIEKELAWEKVLDKYIYYFESFASVFSKEEQKEEYLFKKIGTLFPFLLNVVKMNLDVLRSTVRSKSYEVVQKLKETKRESIGNSNFYDDHQNLLSTCSMINGLQEGPCKRWYLSGALFADLNYLAGQYHGKQTYYYENGNVKSEITYDKGLLHLEVVLYWPNGIMKRKALYQKGSREGLDQQWNDQGVLISQAYYANDLPSHQAQQWNDQGDLIKKILFDARGEVVEDEKTPLQENYLAKTSRTTHSLSGSMDTILSNLEATVEEVIDDPKKATLSHELKEDLFDLKKEMEKLNSLSLELMSISSKEEEEASNDTSLIEETVYSELADLNHKMKNLFDHIDLNVKDLKKTLKKDD